MEDEQRYRVEALNHQHDINNFSCEDEELNEYIQEDALLDMKRGVARTFVEIDTEKPVTGNVAGFFTLRAHTLRIEETYFEDWEADEDGVGYNSAPIEVPLVELMWLARDLQWRGQGVGDILMIDALKMVATAADCIGLIGLHLRSTYQGVRLYRRYKFQQFNEHPYYDDLRYILPIRTLRAILREVGHADETTAA